MSILSFLSTLKQSLSPNFLCQSLLFHHDLAPDHFLFLFVCCCFVSERFLASKLPKYQTTRDDTTKPKLFDPKITNFNIILMAQVTNPDGLASRSQNQKLVHVILVVNFEILVKTRSTIDFRAKNLALFINYN